MKTSLVNTLATLFRWTATLVFCLIAIAGVWQGAFLTNTDTLAATNVGDRVEKAANNVRAGSKDLIRDTKNKVEKTANKNASKVDQADRKGTFAERKAQRDKVRIEERAENHAARTEKAVDKSMDAVKVAVYFPRGDFFSKV
jgi:ribosomal protein S20